MATQIELIKKYGLKVRGHLGQHLLIDPNMQRKIVDVLDPQVGETVLEIGPGLGALTQEILRRGAKVIAVEMDPKFVSILNAELDQPGRGLKVIHKDILKTDLKELLNTAVQAEKLAKKEKSPKQESKKIAEPISKSLGWSSAEAGNKIKKIKVVGNLPYYITAPILFNLLESSDLLSYAVMTMQREVAARLIASPGTKDYGRLTLATRYAADVRHDFDIPPSCFTPQPEVYSSVITLVFRPERDRLEKSKENFLFQVIQVAFSQRRKMLLQLLSKSAVINKTRKELEHVFDFLRIPHTVRGEELLLKDYLSLVREIYPKPERSLDKK